MKHMKSRLVPVSVGVMASIWAFIALYRGGHIPEGLDVFIFLLILLGGVAAFVVAMRQHKDIAAGYPAEDELSTRIKYKTGYHSFMTSMGIWMFIFVFQNQFPDRRSLLGAGILLSALVFMVLRSYFKRTYHED